MTTLQHSEKLDGVGLGIGSFLPRDLTDSLESTSKNQEVSINEGYVANTEESGSGLAGGKGGKPGKGTPASFTVLFSGDVSSSNELGDCSGNRITNRSNQIVINPVELDLSFFIDELEDGDVCFVSVSYSDVMAISEQKDGSILADFYFDASTVNNDVIRYRLKMHGDVELGDDWLPLDGGVTIIDLMGWEMGTDSKGPRKQACTGSGNFVDTALGVVRVDGAPTCP